MAISIKKYLKNFINESIKETYSSIDNLKKQIKALERALIILNKIEIKKANYHIILRSLWAKEGEMSINTNISSSLKKAIQTAEKDFKEKNNRSDVQADYSVKICLGEIECPISEEYWEKHKEK